MLNNGDTIKESIKKLNNEFNRIKRMGYVPEVHRGYGGIGDTFERLLGKEKSDFCVPDYDGIEIKTRRSFSKGLIGLFGSVPDGEELFELDRLREKYGYPDKEIRSAKVLYSVVYGNMLCQVGTKYFFKLDVDRKEEKVFLCVFDKNLNLLERSVYWSFFTLKNKLSDVEYAYNLMNKLYDNEIKILNFLTENKEHWRADETRLVFDNPVLSAQYNSMKTLLYAE